MAIGGISKNQKSKEEEFETLQKHIGDFFKRARISLGYKTPEDFANTFGYTLSQYREYEGGTANPTLLTIFRLLKSYGLEDDDLFKFEEDNTKEFDKSLAEKALKLKIEQLKEQVTLALGKKISLEITENSYFRIFQTLTYCVRPKSKSEILKNLGLKNTTNNFQRIMSPALELNWLDMTNPESPNSPKQRYVISDKGKGVV